MAGFQNYQLPTMPMYGPLAGFLSGFQDAETQRAQELSNLQSLFNIQDKVIDNQYAEQMKQADLAHKQAQIDDYMAKQQGTGYYSKEKPVDPLKTERARELKMAALYPALASIMEPVMAAEKKAPQGYFSEEMSNLLGTRLGDLAASLRESGFDMEADALSQGYQPAKAFYDKMVRSNVVGKLQAGETAAQSRRDVAETNLKGTIYKADSNVTATRIRAHKANESAKKDIDKRIELINQSIRVMDSDPEYKAYVKQKQTTDMLSQYGFGKTKNGMDLQVPFNPKMVQLEKERNELQRQKHLLLQQKLQLNQPQPVASQTPTGTGKLSSGMKYTIEKK